MINLFIDSSYKALFIALTTDKEVIDEVCIMAEANFSEKLLPLLKEMTDRNHISLNNLHKIFVTVGPGSFTGIRIGVTVCKTLGFALKKRIVPISSLEFMATTKTDTDYKIPFIDARHGYVFAGVYDKKGINIVEDSYTNIQNLIDKIKGSITFISYDDLHLDNTILPKYNILDIITRHLNDEGLNPHEVKPNYLKKTEAEEKLI